MRVLLHVVVRHGFDHGVFRMGLAIVGWGSPGGGCRSLVRSRCADAYHNHGSNSDQSPL